MISVGYNSSALTPNQNSFSNMFTTFNKNYFTLFCHRYNGNTLNFFTLSARKYMYSEIEVNQLLSFINNHLFYINSNFQIRRTVFVILAKSERELFDAAVEDYSKYTCVQWKPKTDADKGRFVVVQDRSGCWSYIGMHNFQAGQPLSLAPRCRSVSACVFIKNPFWHRDFHPATLFIPQKIPPQAFTSD